jgi:DNA-binding protein H-NS
MLRRILTIVAILASIGVVVICQVKLREHVQGIIDQRENNAKEREQQRARAEKSEKGHRETSNTLTRVTGSLLSTSNELESTKGTLSQVTSARDKATQDLEKARENEKAARDALARWDGLGVKPEQVTAMRDELGKAKETISAQLVEASILNKTITRLTNELNKYIDPENYVVQLPRGLKGQVLVVDPRWEFVVLDVGEKQGVLKDGIMLVHRNSKLVGKVKITSVLADRSIANVMPGWKADDVKEGDQVLF